MKWIIRFDDSERGLTMTEIAALAKMFEVIGLKATIEMDTEGEPND